MLALSARPLAAAILLLALPALAGCGTRLRDESLLDRCADVMEEAFPGGGIKVTGKEAAPQQGESVASVVVRVQAFRRNVAAGGIPLRDVVAECRFDEGILTGFRWTQGPLR